MKRLPQVVLILIATLLIGAAGDAVFHHDRAAGLKFPKRIGHFECKQLQKYDHPELGYSLQFEANKPWVNSDVYVYNLGKKDIPNGTQSQTVKKQFAQAKSDILNAQRRRHYDSVKYHGDRTVRLGREEDAPRMLCARYDIVQNRRKRGSELYLTGHNNHFIKMRCTYYPEDAQAVRKAIDGLLAGLGAVLQE